MPVYEGGCHCGRVRFQAALDAPIDRIGECNCSICQKKGILHVRVEPESLKILTGADAIETYRFHSRVAEHNFCRHCGIHVTTRPRAAPDKRTVNARCLDDFEAIRDRAQIGQFDGRNHPKDRAE